MDFLTNYEVTIRIGVFVGVFITMALLELLLPRKNRILPRAGRWLTNLGLIIIDTVILKLVIPIAAVSMAGVAMAKGWGLLNLVDWPIWIEIILSIIVLDMLIYWQHVATHHIPILWGLHKVHHADRDIDVTTGVRFHPFEIILSMLYKFICIVVLGPQVIGVFIFEVLLNACAMFNHANIKLPYRFDKLIRQILVTPDMHRVHHSAIPHETNSNYGFSLSLWDRLFGTYIPQPEKGHDDMVIGLSDYQTSKPASLIWSLTLPFMRRPK